MLRSFLSAAAVLVAMTTTAVAVPSAAGPETRIQVPAEATQLTQVHGRRYYYRPRVVYRHYRPYYYGYGPYWAPYRAYGYAPYYYRPYRRPGVHIYLSF